MWPFRRKVGKHELGAAVTAIPSVPLASVLSPYGAQPAPPFPAPPPSAPPAAPEPVASSAPELVAPAVPEATAPVAPAEPEAVLPPYEAPVVAAPRVELGFRDGSTASLAPGSEQAKALTDLAQVLTQRD